MSTSAVALLAATALGAGACGSDGGSAEATTAAAAGRHGDADGGRHRSPCRSRTPGATPPR